MYMVVAVVFPHVQPVWSDKQKAPHLIHLIHLIIFKTFIFNVLQKY